MAVARVHAWAARAERVVGPAAEVRAALALASTVVVVRPEEPQAARREGPAPPI